MGWRAGKGYVEGSFSVKPWQVNQGCISHCVNGRSPRGCSVYPHGLRGQKIERGKVSKKKRVSFFFN